MQSEYVLNGGVKKSTKNLLKFKIIRQKNNINLIAFIILENSLFNTPLILKSLNSSETRITNNYGMHAGIAVEKNGMLEVVLRHITGVLIFKYFHN